MVVEQTMILSELHNFGEVVLNMMDGVPLIYTCSVIDMNNSRYEDVSMTSVLVAQKEDMESACSTSSFANPGLQIYASGVTSMFLFHSADKHSLPHLSSDIFLITVRK